MDRAPEGMHLAAITVTLSCDSEGTEYVEVECSEDDDATATTMLGMLDLARAQILERLT
ncbi:hypothetical protein [Dietzia alimentaria]|uniref:hypothetical protein n=1 Tax=Dietzia alimentaria TaxID=665550 RepID=UPI0002DDCD47|nr:hypothetical protein [Dietzia alimentaria]